MVKNDDTLAPQTLRLNSGKDTETGIAGHKGYVATWEYYTDLNETGRYSNVKIHVNDSGYWTRYDYDVDGLETKRVVPFKDSPVTATDAPG